MNFNRLVSTLGFSLLLLVGACVPKQQIVFKGIKNIRVEAGAQGDPLLKADSFFFNPNKVKSKLKEINVDIFVDGKKSGHVKQELKLAIPAQADFSVPVEAQLALKDMGLLDTVLGLLGGKKYTVMFSGYVKIIVHGVPVKVPVQQQQELKLN